MARCSRCSNQPKDYPLCPQCLAVFSPLRPIRVRIDGGPWVDAFWSGAFDPPREFDILAAAREIVEACS